MHSFVGRGGIYCGCERFIIQIRLSTSLMGTFTIILSSAVISGLVSAAISGWFNLRSKQNEYANGYYKLILERRLAAYEEIDSLIDSIKIAVVDTDNRPHHRLFSIDDNRLGVYKTLDRTMSKSLWLSDELFNITRELNLLVFEKVPANVSLIEFGKCNYKVIAELRTRMEKVRIKDMLTLHDVPAFLKAKKSLDSYSELKPSE